MQGQKAHPTLTFYRYTARSLSEIIVEEVWMGNAKADLLDLAAVDEAEGLEEEPSICICKSTLFRSS